jgi:FecR protein/Putative zinc-finger
LLFGDGDLEMFSRHVTNDLSAYCHGELSNEESRQFAEHLISCSKCRVKFEEIKLGVKLAEQLPQVAAPDHLWNDLQLLIDRQSRVVVAGSAGRKALLNTRRLRYVAMAAVVLFATGIGLWWTHGDQTAWVMKTPLPSWEVAQVQGMPTIGSAGINNKGQLAVGQWLETDGNSRAKISVETIGQVEVDPNTRIRLVQTQPTEHRIELAHGKMSARIWAPPRLFFVDTPSAIAADLGCAYTLEVDDAGASLLRVTSGWVALNLKDRESMVPEGAACRTRPGIGPGTPYFEDASEKFRQALTQLDFEDEITPLAKATSLKVLLDESRIRDTLTLWHLLARVDGADRVHVYERMAQLAPPPEGVTRQGALQLDRQMLELWRNSMKERWSE